MRDLVIAAIVGALVPLGLGLWWSSSERGLKNYLAKPPQPDWKAARLVSLTIEAGPEQERGSDGATRVTGQVRNGAKTPLFDVVVRLVNAGTVLGEKRLGLIRRDEAFVLEVATSPPHDPMVELEFSLGEDTWRLRHGDSLEVVQSEQERREFEAQERSATRRRRAVALLGLLGGLGLVTWLVLPNIQAIVEDKSGPKTFEYVAEPTPGGSDPFGPIGGVEVKDLDRSALQAWKDGLIAPTYRSLDTLSNMKADDITERGDNIPVVCIHVGADGRPDAVKAYFFDTFWMRFVDVRPVDADEQAPECS